MRYVAETYLVDLWLRFGTLTIADLSSVIDSLAQTKQIEPAVVGKLLRSSAIPTPEPHLDLGSSTYNRDTWVKIHAAIGASSTLNLVRTSARLQMIADDREARFALFHPGRNDHFSASILTGVVLSSRNSYFRSGEEELARPA